MQRRLQITATVLLAAVLTSGCAKPVAERAPPPPPAAPPTTPTPSVVETETDQSPSTDAVNSAPADRASAQSDEPPAPDASSIAQYQPPFPDRIDLFVAPKRQGGAHSPAGESLEAVELLGFVNVDQPRAVLSINGTIAPIAAGAAQYGVEVISVQPPMVVLQRGRQRWQATLAN